MAKVDLLKIFLASPGDVDQERQIVKEVLDTVNRTIGREKEVVFEIIGWDTDSYPSYGSDAQSKVNEQVADMAQFDIFVGIMWNRFGSPTPRAGSGTEEEFRRAVESLKKTGRPEIMFYFNQSPFNPSSVAEAEQKLKVLSFKEEIQGDGLQGNYHNAEEFRKLFHRHVETWLIKHSPNALNPPHVEATLATLTEKVPSTKVQPEAEVISNSGMWVLVKSQFSLASEVNEPGDRKISLKIPVIESDEDAFFRSLQPSQYGRQELIPFAHQNTGAIAKVIEAKRTSAGESAIWELVLEMEELNSGFGSDMAYGSISADELAAMRARYILLNEKPTRPSSGNQSNSIEDTFFEVFVQGVSSRVKVEGSVFPSLWKELKGDITAFLPLARLWSVFHLITSNTCEYILDLKLGPVKDGVMHIYFRGQRKKIYSNRDPYIIKFEGDSDLNSE